MAHRKRAELGGLGAQTEEGGTYNRRWRLVSAQRRTSSKGLWEESAHWMSGDVPAKGPARAQVQAGTAGTFQAPGRPVCLHSPARLHSPVRILCLPLPQASRGEEAQAWQCPQLLSARPFPQTPRQTGDLPSQPGVGADSDQLVGMAWRRGTP